MLSRPQKRAIATGALVLLATATVLAAIGRYFESQRVAQLAAEERASLKRPEPIVVTAERRDVERRRDFAARLEPWARASLAPEVAGSVLRRGPEPGTRVAPGDELLALDDTLARAAASAASAQATETARKAAEVAVLAERGVLSPSDRAAAAAAAEIAAREAERARELVARHVLRAPFAGVVQSRLVEVGDYLVPGRVACEIVDDSRLRVVLHAGEREVTSLAAGTRVTVLPATDRQAHLEAVVAHVSPAASPDGRFRVEAVLDPAPAGVPAGSAATVRALVRTYRDQLFVPASAVRFDGEKAVVRRLGADGSETPVAVELGSEVEGAYPVLAGLEPGDRLVVR